MTTESRVPAVAPISSIDIPEKISAEDVLQRIDATIAQVDDMPEPGLLRQLFSGGARRLAVELNSVQAVRVQARREHAEQLMSLIKVYVRAHQQSLKVRSAAFILHTFLTLEAPLYQAGERSVLSFWQTFAQNMTKIATLSLTVEQKAEYAARAWASLLAMTDESRAGFMTLMAHVRAEFVSVRNEIES